MSRCLLHKSKLKAFKEWLTAIGIEHRQPRGDFQVLQVKVKTGWQCVFDRLDTKEHYTVAAPLESTVRRFINAAAKDQS
ncbi:hypothetical protein K6V90_09565 [Cupriavidus pauculus]|uniref:hypothetical protein n=1 Tax=Cupriavidus pauculus TaxID=82633 RepID=UPI001C934E48|nr:hypothetical protein [Cupriavidus pauculus]MBY4730779.1 hypothetical protein [Cupriavidus pauculus]